MNCWTLCDAIRYGAMALDLCMEIPTLSSHSSRTYIVMPPRVSVPTSGRQITPRFTSAPSTRGRRTELTKDKKARAPCVT